MGEMAGLMPGESPLVPYRTMQRMYAGMVESRMLEDRLRAQRKAKGMSTRGQEACRASVLVDLGPEDFASDVPGSVTAAYLCGAELGRLVGMGAPATAKNLKKESAQAPALKVDGLLPLAEDAAERFRVAMGVALALKRLKLAKVVVVFAGAQEVKASVWRKALRFAVEEELPMLFVVLPEAAAKAGKDAKRVRPFAVSAAATAMGVPGIPVDASDAVALYRVAQESMGRARAGGGPALMECVHFVLDGDKRAGKKNSEADPIVMMGETLLRRKVCGERWLAAVATSFQTRLDAV